MKCIQCGNEFKARFGAKTCSAKCRQANRRKCDKSVTAKCDNVTDSPKCDTTPCTHLHCAAAKARGVNTVLHRWTPASELGPHEANRVSLPGDVDYDKGVG